MTPWGHGWVLGCWLPSAAVGQGPVWSALRRSAMAARADARALAMAAWSPWSRWLVWVRVLVAMRMARSRSTLRRLGWGAAKLVYAHLA